VSRSFDCHRYKAIRDYLSDLGLLEWADHGYVAPSVQNGQWRKGRACKWRAGEKLMGLLNWETDEEKQVDRAGRADEEGEERAPFVGTGATPLCSLPDSAVDGPVILGMEKGEAPLVGTDIIPYYSLPTSDLMAIQSLARTPESEAIRPVEEGSAGSYRMPTPEELTRIVLDYERLMAA
jgi:hypothetical protein